MGNAGDALHNLTITLMVFIPTDKMNGFYYSCIWVGYGIFLIAAIAGY